MKTRNKILHLLLLASIVSSTCAAAQKRPQAALIVISEDDFADGDESINTLIPEIEEDIIVRTHRVRPDEDVKSMVEFLTENKNLPFVGFMIVMPSLLTLKKKPDAIDWKRRLENSLKYIGFTLADYQASTELPILIVSENGLNYALLNVEEPFVNLDKELSKEVSIKNIKETNEAYIKEFSKKGIKIIPSNIFYKIVDSFNEKIRDLKKSELKNVKPKWASLRIMISIISIISIAILSLVIFRLKKKKVNLWQLILKGNLIREIYR